MEKKNKIMASLVVVAMLAMSFAVVWTAVDTDAADPSLQQMPTAKAANYGKFNVYVMYGVGTPTWTMQQANGYNAAIAVNSLNLGFSLDMNYTTYVTSPYGNYWDINPYYGQISLPYVYNSTTYNYADIRYYDESASAWVPAPTDALGFYKPFDDYDLKTANIAIRFHVSDIEKMYTPSPDGTLGKYQKLVPKSTIVGNSDFAVTFNLSANAALLNMNYPGSPDHNDQICELASSGGVLVGYGSDCYLALKQVTTLYWIPMSGQSNVIDPSQTNKINTSYGSVQDLLGLNYGYESIPSGIRYYYWSLYLDANLTMYADWLLGFMSPLTEASALGLDPAASGIANFVKNEFWLYYSYS